MKLADEGEVPAPVTKGVLWYAKGGELKRCGPFQSQVEAAAYMTLLDGSKPDNFATWPEEAE